MSNNEVNDTDFATSEASHFTQNQQDNDKNPEIPRPKKFNYTNVLIILSVIVGFVGLCIGLFFITGMNVFITIMSTVLFILFPGFIIFLCSKIKFLSKVGVVLLCYVSGIIVGNVGILPDFFSGAQSTIQDISVTIALPLLLFSLNIKKWVKMAKSGLIAMLLAVVAIALVTMVLFFSFGMTTKAAQLSGLSVGVYTGGTPNIAAIYKSIGVTVNRYILFNTYDTVLSLIYVIFLSTVARKFFLKLFKIRPYTSVAKSNDELNENIFDESVEAYTGMFKKNVLPRLLRCLGLSIILLGVAYIIGDLCGSYATAVTILLITSGGIGFSFVKPVREIKKTFQLGMYIIYVFCFTVATMADVRALINIDWTIFAFVGISISGSLILHAILCKVAKIDVDTMIIVSTSAICSPPFVPVVANGLKNPDVMLTGLITGIIGYAIGNYLGIGIYYLYSLMI